MTSAEAVKVRARLLRLVALEVSSLATWLALLEDEVRVVLPEQSHLLTRFMELKTKAQNTAAADSDGGDETALQDTRPEFRELFELIGDHIYEQAHSSADIREEVEQIIQKGYFESIYFRAVLGGLALVFLLATGVEGWQLGSQVKAMKELVAEARQEVENGKKQVADAKQQVEEGKLEVLKAQQANQEEQGKLALMLLNGDQQLVSARTKAIQQVQADALAQETAVRDEAKRWSDEIANGVGPQAKVKVEAAGNNAVNGVNSETRDQLEVFRKVVNSNEQALNTALNTAVRNLQAAKAPWIPTALWSMEKKWLLMPLALVLVIVSILNWLLAFTSVSNHAQARRLSVVNFVVLLSATVTLIVMYLRTS